MKRTISHNRVVIYQTEIFQQTIFSTSPAIFSASTLVNNHFN